MAIERYQDLVPDWDAFVRASDHPEPVTFRVNTARVAPGALRHRLESAGFGLEPVPGLDDFLRVTREPFPISRTVEHWLGQFYIQQAVTGVAPLALGPRPGERILDLCAAPGGKASHLAELLGGRGVVVAGERNEGRIRALLGNLYRLGHTGVMVVSADGRAFPGGALFDRVLVDVPCSAEGNVRRKRGGQSAAVPESFRTHIVGVQRRLLRRAVELTRPGGVILYVTCTFAPEENEAVVARALERFPVTIEPVELDLPHAPGLTHFQGRAFPPELRHAWRLYPHHLDSGGLFIARLRRHGGSAAEAGSDHSGKDGWSEVPAVFAETADGEAGTLLRPLEEALRWLQEEMGVPGAPLTGARWMSRGDSVWMHTCAEWPLEAWETEAREGTGAPHPGRASASRAPWRFVSAGFRAFRRESGGRLRPTNDLLRWLDARVADRTLTLDASECLRLLEAGELAAVNGGRDGYVALRLGSHVVGRGFMRSGRLRSQIPGAQARSLAEALRIQAGSVPR